MKCLFENVKSISPFRCLHICMFLSVCACVRVCIVYVFAVCVRVNVFVYLSVRSNSRPENVYVVDALLDIFHVFSQCP